MKSFDRGVNTAYFGTTSERVALPAANIPPFAEWWDTDMNAYFDWFGSWVQRATGGGGGGGGDASAVNQTATQGAVAPGSVAQKSTLAGLVYTQTGIVVANGQQVAQQADASGNTKMRMHGTAAAGSDGVNNTFAFISGHNQSTGNNAVLPVAGMLLNAGGTFDRPRGTGGAALVLPSARTGTNRSQTFGTTAAVLAAANANRTGLIMQNLDATKTFYWAVGADPVAGALGTFELGPKGSVFLQEGYVDAGEIRGIASAAPCNVSAREY